MSSDAPTGERIIDILCARALQAAGRGFPATEEEIDSFEASLAVAEEERGRLAIIVEDALQHAFEQKDDRGDSPLPSVLGRIRGQFSSASLSYAARKAKDEELSPELEDELQRLMDEAPDAAAEEDPEYGDDMERG